MGRICRIFFLSLLSFLASCAFDFTRDESGKERSDSVNGRRRNRGERRKVRNSTTISRSELGENPESFRAADRRDNSIQSQISPSSSAQKYLPPFPWKSLQEKGNLRLWSEENRERSERAQGCHKLYLNSL